MINIVYRRTSSACHQLQRAWDHVTSRNSARNRLRGDRFVSAIRAVDMPRAVFSDAAGNASVHMDVLARECVAISTALQSRF